MSHDDTITLPAIAPGEAVELDFVVRDKAGAIIADSLIGDVRFYLKRKFADAHASAVVTKTRAAGGITYVADAYDKANKTYANGYRVKLNAGDTDDFTDYPVLYYEVWVYGLTSDDAWQLEAGVLPIASGEAQEARPFTYDISTARGLTRFYADDTDKTAPIWSDAEIDAVLVESGSVPMAAAAFLLMNQSLRAARKAILRKGATLTVDLTKRAAEIRKQGEMLLAQAPVAPVVTDPPKQWFVLTPDDGEDAEANMEVW